ncbi:hypothetical protein ABZ714_09540 [Streptomyces sp. NPDC006798]|uniref:hypothetical protein n=1 Tax=Streptomyces sp. NPDC006798 TaxID=3155462 RepID=UPI0033E67DA6
MPDSYEIWRLAALRRDANALAPFVAYATADPDTAREALRLSAQVFAATPAELDEAQDAVDTLRTRADALTPHPHQPDTPRPSDADARTRDYVADIRREALDGAAPEWRFTVRLFLSVGLRELLRRPLPPEVREDALYLHTRTAMALDLGHREAAEAELARFQRLRREYA